jgi:UDP-GlcNAc:undecaprenyl-phosphate GlcNAc-1-phosphate transferase
VIIYAIPIIDTTLAIVRRKMSGKAISEADDQHLHHILKRALGVKGAVFVLYGIGVGFAALGILLSEGRQRVVYALVAILASYIGVIALKIGRREHIEREMTEAEARRAASKPHAGDEARRIPGSTPSAETKPAELKAPAHKPVSNKDAQSKEPAAKS